jgi:uncharacterized protein (TIGR02145 family)
MRLALSIFALLVSAMLLAQAPALIPYQAIARNPAGEPMASSSINARFTIHDLTATGTSVWQELQTVSTSSLGLFTAQLGSSVPLTIVDWANGAKFMQVELDLGNGFIDIGTQQLLSVPYALYAGESPDEQQLSVSETGDTLFLENGGFVIIPGISEANITNGGGNGNCGQGETAFESMPHTCGAEFVLNPDLNYGSLTDQEGNVYRTISIGSQEWMAENLTTSIYRNGEEVLTNLDNMSWQNTTDGAWAYYNNDVSFACPYGKLYNWFACTDERQLCPTGWHVPSLDEWLVFVDYLGGESVAGGQMKTVGNLDSNTGLWLCPNNGATNSSGFSGIPGGYRNLSANDAGMGYSGNWWSTSEVDALNAWPCWLTAGFTSFLNTLTDDDYKQNGYSVRCLRD